MGCNCQANYSAGYPIPITVPVTGIQIPGISMAGGMAIPKTASIQYRAGLDFLKTRIGPISVGVAILGVLAVLLVVRYKKTSKVLFEAPKVKCPVCGNKDIPTGEMDRPYAKKGELECPECGHVWKQTEKFEAPKDGLPGPKRVDAKMLEWNNSKLRFVDSDYSTIHSHLLPRGDTMKIKFASGFSGRPDIYVGSGSTRLWFDKVEKVMIDKYSDTITVGFPR